MSFDSSRGSDVEGFVDQEPVLVGDLSGSAGSLQRLCRAAVRSLDMTGAAVSVIIHSRFSGLGVASDIETEAREEFQFTLGEGPNVDAVSGRKPVLVSELDQEMDNRWPGYARGAYDRGVRAVFAFPLQIGAAKLGAMTLYRDRPGPMPGELLSQALTFADLAIVALLDGQELAARDGNPVGLDAAMDSQVHVHQAQGMVMVQLGVSLSEAMARLRAYSYANDRRLSDVARDIVSRMLQMDQDPS